MAARKFTPSLHPRDKFGRFTRSRSAAASPAELQRAADIAAGLKPKRGAAGSKASAYLSQIAPSQHRDTVAKYTAGDYITTHKALRAGETSDASVQAMDAAMIELPDGLVVSRRVPASQFGSVDVDELVGLKVRDAAYAPTSIGAVRATKGDVRLRIAVPAGTRAAVNPDTGEVILDRDLEMVVARVERNPAGNADVFLVVLPKNRSDADTDTPTAEPVKAPAKKVAPRKAVPAKPAAPDPDETPEGGEQVRNDLMKLKVPELQARMRERGLKPGRMRKSQMVDALVADETGGENPVSPRSDVTPDTRPFHERVKAAAAGREALNAAPLSALPRSRNDPAMTPDRRRILADWRIGEAGDVDDTLNVGGEVSPAAAARVGLLDDLMAASPLASDVVLYRSAPTARDVFGDAAGGNLTGAEVNMPSFVPATASRQRAQDAAGRGLVMRSVAPQGAGAIAMSSRDAEMLLDRGHTFRVVADHGRDADGRRNVDVEMLPKTGAETDPFTVVETAETRPDRPLSPEQIAALPDSPLGRGLASGIASVKELAGGNVGDVRLVTFNDGSRAVQKLAQTAFAGTRPQELTDTEDLAGRVGQAIGAPVPQVVRTNNHEVFMEYVADARPGMSVLNRIGNTVERAGKFEEFIDSRDGRLLGVLDLIVGNGDRHAGNGLVRKDGTITGIDHGLAWPERQTSAPDVRAVDPDFDSPFAGRLFGDQFSTDPGWRSNDLTAADVAWMRGRVEALRPDFERLGRGAWLDYTLTRLDQLGEHASGTRNRVAP